MCWWTLHLIDWLVPWLTTDSTYLLLVTIFQRNKASMLPPFSDFCLTWPPFLATQFAVSPNLWASNYCDLGWLFQQKGVFWTGLDTIMPNCSSMEMLRIFVDLGQVTWPQSLFGCQMSVWMKNTAGKQNCGLVTMIFCATSNLCFTRL